MAAVAREVYHDVFCNIVKCYVDVLDLTFKPDTDIVLDGSSEIYYAIGVLDLELKLRLEQMSNSRGYRPWTLIHPTAYIADSATIGQGCFIAPHVAIAIDAVIGDHSIVHFHSSIGHGARLGRHCAVLPGARVSGRAQLGDGVLVGSNAFVYQGTQVGEGAKIDALTYVKDELPAGAVVSVRRKSSFSK